MNLVQLADRVDTAAAIYHDGACNDLPLAVFFPDPKHNPVGRPARNADPRPDPYAQARRICAGCPTRTVCAELAITGNEPAGLWGGLDPDERDAIRAQRRRAVSA